MSPVVAPLRGIDYLGMLVPSFELFDYDVAAIKRYPVLRRGPAIKEALSNPHR